MRLKHTDSHKTSRTLVDHDNRRGFLQKAGIIVGGLSLWGFPLQQGQAQDATESCRPPGDLGNPVPFNQIPGNPYARVRVLAP